MRKPTLSGLGVFVAVVERGSLRAAAAHLGVRPPAISYQLKAFEEQVGASMCVRTTRSIKLTDAGMALYSRARPAMMELTDALEAVRDHVSEPQGILRISLPQVVLGTGVGERIADFQRRYPKVELDLSFDEAFIDIVSEGFHAGIRLGDRIQEDMIAIRLTPPLKEACFAAPSYLKEHGVPKVPGDLLTHRCIRYRFIASQRIYEWRFRDGDNEFVVDVKGNLVVNNFSSLVELVRCGIGVGQFLYSDVEKYFRDGCLVNLLDTYTVEHPGFFLYYPRANSKLQKLKLFSNVIKAPRSGI